MSEISEVIIEPTHFTTTACIQRAEETNILDDTLLKVRMRNDSDAITLHITGLSGTFYVTLKGAGIFSDKTVECMAGKTIIIRNFESKFYKQRDGYIYVLLEAEETFQARLTSSEG